MGKFGTGFPPKNLKPKVNPGLDNLVAYYSCDDASGTIFDSTLNSVDLNVFSIASPETPPTYGQEGKKGTGIRFSGSEWAEKNNNDPITGYPFSQSCWFKCDAGQSGCMTWYGVSSSGASYYDMHCAGGALQISSRNFDPVNLSGGSGADDENWHFAVGVWVSSTERYGYLDGNLVLGSNNETSVSFNGTADDIAIGRRNDSTPGNYFEGVLDEVAFFNKALSQEEIWWMFNNGEGREYGDYGGVSRLQELVGWWSADQGVYSDANSPEAPATDGQVVSEWRDISGNGNHLTQTTAASKPLFQTNQQNGLPGLQFQGTDDFLSLGGALLTAAPMSIYIVAEAANLSEHHTVLSMANNAATNSYFAAAFRGNDTGDPARVWARDSSTIGDGRTTTAYLVNTPHLLTGVFTSSSLSNSYKDGKSKTTETSTITPWSVDSFVLGRQNSSNEYEYLTGYIYEIRVYNVAHGESTRKQIEREMAQKWGLDVTPLNQGLVAHWKADAGAYNDAGTTLATNGQTVQQWNDQSGEGYNLSQATSADRPTYNTNQLNGQPGINFNHLVSPDNLRYSGVPISEYPVTIYCVAECETFPTYQTIIALQEVGAFNGFNMTLRTDGVDNDFRWADNAITTTKVSTDTPFILTGMSENSTSHKAWLDGGGYGFSSTSKTFPSGIDQIQVGLVEHTGEANNFDGNIYEIMIFNTYHTDEERQQIESYLGTKYNITLPKDTIKNGLLGYWNLDESSGTRADSHGTNNLTLNGSNGTTTGPNGDIAYSKADVDGDYLEGGQVFTSAISAISVSCWARKTANSLENFTWANEWETATGKESWHVGLGRINGFDSNFRVLLSGDGTNIQKDYSMGSSHDDNTWRHYVFTYDNGTLKMYVDGVEISTTKDVDTSITTLNNTTHNLRVGGNSNATPTWADDGDCALLGIWNRALTSGEISYLYNSTNGRRYSQLGGI